MELRVVLKWGSFGVISDSDKRFLSGEGFVLPRKKSCLYSPKFGYKEDKK